MLFFCKNIGKEAVKMSLTPLTIIFLKGTIIMYVVLSFAQNT